MRFLPLFLSILLLAFAGTASAGNADLPLVPHMALSVRPLIDADDRIAITTALVTAKTTEAGRPCLPSVGSVRGLSSESRFIS